MKKYLFILFCMPALLYAQEWNYTFGENTINEKSPRLEYSEIDNTYTIAYFHKTSEIFTTHILKMNDYGEILWHKTFEVENTYEESENFEITDIDLKNTNDGGCIIASHNIYKLDKAGNLEWTKEEHGRIIIQKEDSSYIYKSNTPYSNSIESSFIHLDYFGNAISTYYNQYYPEMRITNNITPIANNGYAHTTTFCVYIMIDFGPDEILCGNYFGTVNTYGNSKVSTTTSGESFGNFNHVLQTKNKEFISCGSYESAPFIYRLDTNNILWKKVYRYSSNFQTLNHIEETHDGGFIAIGSYVIRTDENGDTIWTTDISGNEIHQTKDSSFVLIRTITDSISGDENINIIKLDSNGKIMSASIKPPEPPNPNGKLINIIDFTGKKTKAKANIPLIYIYENGTAEKKMIIE